MLILLCSLFFVSVGYQIFSTLAAAQFSARRPQSSASVRCSQIKPVRSVEPTTLKTIESFLRTRGGADHDMYLCSAESGPQEWLEAWPQVTWLRLRADQSQNGKAATLALGQRYWSGDIFIISDADMHCELDYLEAVLGEFRDPKVGVVTALYRAVESPHQSWGGLLEALCILDFASSVLVAEKTEGVSFALGSTMAIRREALQEIGGFEALVPYLADDFQLGYKASQKGWKVRLAPTVLQTELGHPSLRQALSHQYRWLVTSKISRPGGHVAFLVTQGLLWSGLLCLCWPEFGWPLMALWCLLRWSLGWLQDRFLSPSSQAARPWQILFLPWKDVVYLGLWASSLWGRKVMWGHQEITLDGEGKITKH